VASSGLAACDAKAELRWLPPLRRKQRNCRRCVVAAPESAQAYLVKTRMHPFRGAQNKGCVVRNTDAHPLLQSTKTTGARVCVSMFGASQMQIARHSGACWDALDEDTLRLLLLHLQDAQLVRLMRLSRSVARAVKSAFGLRHELEEEQAAAALQVLLGHNVFITGGPGTGKSHLTKLLIKLANAQFSSRVAVAAPTWLAAGAIGGNSIDKTLGFRKMCPEQLPVQVTALESVVYRSTQHADDCDESDGESDEILPEDVFAPVESSTLRATLSSLRVLFVDEISMVSDYKLFLMVQTLRHYGRDDGLPQLVLIGDFCQLPPVIPRSGKEWNAVRQGTFRQFCFCGSTWHSLQLQLVQLRVSRRCGNFNYNCFLSKMRQNVFDEDAFVRLTSAKVLTHNEAAEEGRIGLFGRNRNVKEYNKANLQASEAPLVRVAANDYPTPWGSVPRTLPQCVDIKTGLMAFALVSFYAERLNPKRAASRWVCKGTLLRIVRVVADADSVIVSADDGEQMRVCRNKSERRYFRLGDSGPQSELASRRQLPLQHTAALTVHKAQGRSIAKEQFVDFDTLWHLSGMMYVLLSRTTDPSLIAHANVGLASQRCHVAPEVLRFYKSVAAASRPFWA